MHNSEILYIIEHIDSGMTKIGITADWFSRSKALKLHEKTKLIGLFEPDDMEEAEKELHRLFRKNRLPGSEYFHLTKAQQEDVLSKAREDYMEAEDLTGIYQKMAKNTHVDVTKAIRWSASDWLRLNKTSWRRSISDMCNWPEDDAIIEAENAVCKKQINEIAVKIDNRWGLGASEQIASEMIGDEFFRHHTVSLDKKLFNRRGWKGSSISFYLKREIADNLFDHLEFTPALGKAQIKIKGIQIERETLRFFLEHWANFRGPKYCDEAAQALVDKKRFGYYLSCLGPMTADWID